jgi:hypothetical protein
MYLVPGENLLLVTVTSAGKATVRAGYYKLRNGVPKWL